MDLFASLPDSKAALQFANLGPAAPKAAAANPPSLREEMVADCSGFIK